MPEFELKLECEIKYAFFFKGHDKNQEDEILDEDDFKYKPLNLLKKNYVMVDVNNKIIIKNLGIRKKSNSALSRKIFWDYLVPQIKEGQIKFSRAYLRNLIQDLLQQDISLAALRKDVGHINQYNKSPNSLSAQITKKYGAGIYFLIPNTKGIGVGKGKSYCTLEEFKEHNLRLEHIDLSNVWSELEYFIKPVVTKNIFDYEVKT